MLLALIGSASAAAAGTRRRALAIALHMRHRSAGDGLETIGSETNTKQRCNWQARPLSSSRCPPHYLSESPSLLALPQAKTKTVCLAQLPLSFCGVGAISLSRH